MFRNTLFSVILLIGGSISLHAETEGDWQTKATQIYSNASSFQFYTTFTVIRQLLESEWDKALYQRVMFYLMTDMQGLSAYERKFADDERWGSWFEEKIKFQKEILTQLEPLVETKRSGGGMTAEDLARLTEMDAAIISQLLK